MEKVYAIDAVIASATASPRILAPATARV